MTSDGPSTDSWDEVFVWGSSNTIWYEGFSKDLDLDSTYSSFIVSSEYPSFIDPWESTSFVDLLEYPGFNRFIDPLECSSFIEQLESSPGFKAAWKSKWESIFVDLLERPCFNILCERPCFKAKWESKWKQEFESLKQNSAWGEAWARRKALPLSELPSIDKQPGSFRFPKDPSMLIRTGPHMHLYLQERWKMLDEVHLDVVTKSLARSERALDDLVELVQKSNDVGKTVLPIIFYGVDPSDVPNQTGSFAEAFAYYDKKYKDEPGKVERWRAALRKLGNLAGWDSKHWTEGKLIQDVVDETRRILCSSFSKPPEKIMSSTPSWSFSCRQKHDVFLSFRGKDTRLNFLDHLYDHYDALIQCRISTFRDDKDLHKGMSIRKQLDKAIEGSRVCVVIVSPNYASSKWCLDELLKILECRKASKVGKEHASMMKAFAKYEEAHTLMNAGKTHKGKASLRNKENTFSILV